MAFDLYKDSSLPALSTIPEHLEAFWVSTNPVYHYKDACSYEWHCPQCDYRWQATMKVMKSRKLPCRVCSSPLLEWQMYQVLKAMKTKGAIKDFEYKKRIRAGMLDFWVTGNNGMTIAIETDSAQHFYWQSIFPSQLQAIKVRDQAKNDWCRHQNIPLLRFSYKIDAKDYEPFIQECLKTGQTQFIGDDYQNQHISLR